MIPESEIDRFFLASSLFDPQKFVLLDYLFQTDLDPRYAAATLCAEQSTAQWKRPDHDEDFRIRYGAKIVSIEELDSSEYFSKKTLHVFHPLDSSHLKLYSLRIAHPLENFGPSLPNFLSAAAGEGVFYCPGIRQIKWVDFTLPHSFLSAFEGPKFGLEALRKRFNVFGRPFWIGVVKPNLGLPPDDFASLAAEGWRGGLDFAKDDEMLADGAGSVFEERLKKTTSEKRKVEKEIGKLKGYVCNITAELEESIRRYEQAIEHQADAVMLNTFFTGLPMLRSFRRRGALFLMSHFTGIAAISRVSNFGVSTKVWTRLQRLAGADLIVLAGFDSRMQTPEEEVLENVAACLEPWGPILPSLPIPGGSDWAGTLPNLIEKIGHFDFGLIAGRGVFGHPNGPRAGAESLDEAFLAFKNHVPLEVAALRSSSLSSALKEFSKS